MRLIKADVLCRWLQVTLAVQAGVVHVCVWHPLLVSSGRRVRPRQAYVGFAARSMRLHPPPPALAAYPGGPGNAGENEQPASPALRCPSPPIWKLGGVGGPNL